MNDKILLMLESIKTIENQNELKDFEYVPCSAEDIERFNNWLEKELGGPVSQLDGFLEFCKITDGFNSDGVFFYSLNPDKYTNIYRMNQEGNWEILENKDYLLLGNGSLDAFAYKPGTGEFVAVDQGCLCKDNEFKRYKTVDELIEAALNQTQWN